MDADENAVASILKDYETALNGSDTEAPLKLYAPDGVFMPHHSLASIGTEAVRKAYEAVFAAITLTVKFEIAEILLLHNQRATRLICKRGQGMMGSPCLGLGEGLRNERGERNDEKCRHTNPRWPPASGNELRCVRAITVGH